VSHAGETRELVEAFRRGLGAGPSADDDLGERAALEAGLARALAVARAAWPTLRVDAAAWARHLGGHVPAGVRAVEWLAGTPVDDVYLAFACCCGDVAAIAALEARYFGEARVVLRPFGLDADAVEELLQRLRLHVVVGDGVAPPRLARYSGRGRLGGWLRAALLRLALDERRGDVARRLGTESMLEAVTADAAPADVQYLRLRHRAEFAEALEQALASLAPRQRTLLRLRYVEGVQVQRIARIYAVDRATASRQLSDARERLLRATRQRLQARLRLSESELDSLVRVVQSDLHLSLARVLPDASDPPRS
jgi:RNA polymerase sigma-70 factor, ECF subfamily